MEPAVLAAVSAALLAFGAISLRAERTPLTPPIFFVAAGFLLGEGGLGWIDLSLGGEGIHALAELTLVLVLFTDAARIDVSCLRHEGALPVRMLAIGLPLTVAAGALAAALVFPGFGPWEALLLAAILAPTDAALGQAVVSNPSVPVRIRQSLNVESGLNDGIALPLVLLLASLAGATEAGGGLAHWLRFAGGQVVLGPLVGAVVGVAGGRALELGARAGWINAPFQRLSGLGLALLAFSVAELVGGNGFIAAFVGGLALGNTARTVCSRLYEFGEAEGQLLALLVFLLFGGAMVPLALTHADARALLYAVASLTLVRMLPVAIALMGSGLRTPSLAFLGWFGPRGLASILFALVVVEPGLLASGGRIESVAFLTVLLSTVLHGTTAYPLAQRYGSWVDERAARCAVELEPVSEMPPRLRHAEGVAPS